MMNTLLDLSARGSKTPGTAREWTPDPEPSLAWFACLTRAAVRVVGARRVVPAVVDEGPFTVARWRQARLVENAPEWLKSAAEESGVDLNTAIEEFLNRFQANSGTDILA